MQSRDHREVNITPFTHRRAGSKSNDDNTTDGAGRPVRLAMVSCGLGNVHRGFEVSTARWFSALKKQDGLNVRLFAGGKYPDSTLVYNLPRDFMLNWVLRAFTPFNKRRVWEFAYGSEMVTFAVGMLPQIIAWKPDVIWTKEAPFGYVLLFFRDLLGLKFKIVLANGGGFKPQTNRVFDFIQHLQPSSYQAAIEEGMPAEKMQVLPHFARYNAPVEPRSTVRSEFGYDNDDFVVICVSAWNKYHKRIDYIIEEMALIEDDRFKLLLVGQPEPDTPFLKELARKKLGERASWLTLPPEGVHRALFASDAYVIASVNEVFGAATIEAALAELPIVCHPNEGTRYILGDHCGTLDLEGAGVLAERLKELKANPPERHYLKEVRARVEENFSEDILSKKFAHSIIQLASNEAQKTVGSPASRSCLEP